VHWLRDTAYAEDANTEYAGTVSGHGYAAEISPSSCFYFADIEEVTRTLQAIERDGNRMLSYLPL
jgi:hypothetical protein